MKKILALATILLITSCTSKTTQLSVVVPQGSNFTAQDLNRATVRKQATGTDTTGILLFFPIGFPNFENALDDALTQGSGDVMTNATITDEANWYLLFGWQRITVTGDVVNTLR